MIEPGESFDRNFFATEFELARGLEAGEGVVVAGVAGSGGFSAEAFFALIGEGFEGSGGKFEADASGRIGSCHLEGGVGFTLEGPVGDPDLHILLGNFHLSECASAEFFGEDEATGLNIGDSEVSEVDVADRPSRVGLGGFRLQSVAKEGEFIAVGIAFFVVEVAGEVPPFGFKLGVSSVIAREGPGPGGEGAGPGLGRMEERGGEGKEKNGEKLFHSERRASAGERREARHAGGREARRQATIMPITIPMREG